mmetsp:Transcript_14640/g.40334  ORF Transcript_14640/g.40334 Transcript_14640/m.40334 type:complete len:211 (-) Transcript_14640:39-671(-)
MLGSLSSPSGPRLAPAMRRRSCESLFSLSISGLRSGGFTCEVFSCEIYNNCSFVYRVTVGWLAFNIVKSAVPRSGSVASCAAPRRPPRPPRAPRPRPRVSLAEPSSAAKASLSRSSPAPRPPRPPRSRDWRPRPPRCSLRSERSPPSSSPASSPATPPFFTHAPSVPARSPRGGAIASRDCKVGRSKTTKASRTVWEMDDQGNVETWASQ